MYLTLGVAPGASQEAVKRAYKRLAKRYHPDVLLVGEEPTTFYEIKRAYETLTAERGNLSNVSTDEWRSKWMTQLREMREVERGDATVNVRRRRVVRRATTNVGEAGAAPAATPAEEEASGGRGRSGEPEPEQSSLEAEEDAWQRSREAEWAVRAQLRNLKDRDTRRRRRVTPPQKGKFVEPFADMSPTAHDDEWNHSVQ